MIASLSYKQVQLGEFSSLANSRIGANETLIEVSGQTTDVIISIVADSQPIG